MRIAISGSTGLVGSALAEILPAQGHVVVPIVRGNGAGIAWDGGEHFDAAALRTCDAIIHLAGANLAARRWSAAFRAEIRDSRVVGTAALARLLAADAGAVRTLIVASGAGFYGERGEAEVDERSPLGAGFLAEVCRDWEAAADPCRACVRTVHLRLGVVLSRRGGALPKMIGPARFGLAGALGSGRQWWPWIALDDLVRVVGHVLADAAISGPLNAVAPQPVRQIDLARAVAAAVHRPAWGPPVPRWALRLMIGGMAEEVLLASTRAVPRVLMQSTFAWSQGGVSQAVGSGPR